MKRDLTPLPAPRPLRWSPAVAAIRAVLGADAASAEGVYLVGGVVRDAFWGLPTHDVDLAVADGAFRTARRIADRLDGAFYKLDPARETGRAIVEIDGETVIVDVATFRGDDLLADLVGRDFTLNAVAVPLVGDLDHVVDPLDGLADAGARVLRRCSPESIRHDPLRALRAVRLSVKFRLRIEPETLRDIRAHGPGLRAVSPERLRDETFTLLGGARPAAALRTLHALGLLPIIVPEAAEGDSLPHALARVDYTARVLETILPTRTDNTAAQAGLGMIVYYLDRFRAALQAHLAQAWPNGRGHAALLVLAALLRAAEPSVVEARGEALRLSREEIRRLTQIVALRGLPEPLLGGTGVSRREAYRFWRDAGIGGVDVLLLHLADYLARTGPALDPETWSDILQRAGELLAGYFGDEAVRVVDLPPLVSGREVIKALNLRPGPQVGDLLEVIREAQAAGEITSPAEALALARDWLAQG